MSDRLKDIPRLRQDAANLPAVIEAIREALQTFRGYRGDRLDRALTARDIIDGTLDTILGGAGGGGTTIIGGGGGGGGSITIDPTPPPTATGLAVTAGIGHIYIQHDTPTYTQGRGHRLTNVYGAKWAAGDPTPPTYSEAVFLFAFEGTIGAYPSDPATRWCIWIKWQSNDGYESTDPAGGTNGQQATTGQDVALLLEVLTDKITRSQLYSDLGKQIDTISVFGGNLLPNSSFEIDYDGNGTASLWGSHNNTDVLEPSVITLVPGRNGGRAQRVTWVGTNTSSKGLYTNSSLTDPIGVGGVQGGWKAGTTYVVSFFARRSAAAGVGMALAWNTAPASTTVLLNPNLTIDWQRYAFRLVMGGSVEALGALYVSIALTAALTGWVEIDDIMVTEGDQLVAYRPGAADAKAGVAIVEAASQQAANGDSALALSISTVAAAVDGANAAIVTEQTARANADTSIATSLNVLESRIANGSAAPFTAVLGWEMNNDVGGWTGYPSSFGLWVPGTYASLLTTHASGRAYIIRQLSAAEVFNGGKADKIRVRLKRVNSPTWYGVALYGIVGGHAEDGGFYRQIPEPEWAPDGWAVAEWDMGYLTAGGTDWLTHDINMLRLDLAATGSPALAGYEIDWIAVGSRAGSALVASIAQEATTRATVDGHLSSAYTLRVQLSEDGRTVVGGFGITGTDGPSEGPEIEMAVLATRFSVAAPVGATDVDTISPFVVQTSDQTINGVLIPKGVYMDAAFINNLTAMVAKLGEAWIDTAMIASLNADKINAGSLKVGAYIQSTNYVAGVSGFRFSAAGALEAQSAVIRGTVYASAGSIGGITLDATSLYSSNYVAGASGFKLRSDGSVEFANIYARGNIEATSLNVRSALSGGRVEYTNSTIKVFDTSGVLRVKIGNLDA